MTARKLTIVFFLYLFIEGALRKWVFPGIPTAVLFAVKDVILLAAFARLLMGPRSERQRVPFQASHPAIWLTWFVLAVAYFLISGATLEAAIGLRYYLACIPLVFLVPAMIRDFDDLHRLAYRLMLISCAIGVLGTIQFYSPPDSLINSYAWRSLEDIATFGVDFNRARITGTFSYISTYAAFLQAMLIIGVAMVLLANTRRAAMFVGLSVALILANISMTGSRAPFLLALISITIFLLSELIHARGRARRMLLLGLGFVLFVALWVQPFFALFERAEAVGQDSTERITGVLLSPLYSLRDAGPFGSGIGSTFLGLGELTGRDVHALAEETFNEVLDDRLAVELGVFGYLGLLWLKLGMMAVTMKLHFRARTKETRIWSLAALVCQLMSGWSIPIYNAIASAFYFSSIGLVYWLVCREKVAAHQRLHSGLMPQSRAANFVR